MQSHRAPIGSINYGLKSICYNVTAEEREVILNRYWSIVLAGGSCPRLSDTTKALWFATLMPLLIDDFTEKIRKYESYFEPLNKGRCYVPSFIGLLTRDDFCLNSCMTIEEQAWQWIAGIPSYCSSYNNSPYRDDTNNMPPELELEVQNIVEDFLRQSDGTIDLFEIVVSLLQHVYAWPFLLSSICMYTLFATKDDADQLAYRVSMAGDSEASGCVDELGPGKWAYDAYPLGLVVAVFYCKYTHYVSNRVLDTLGYLYPDGEVSKKKLEYSIPQYKTLV